MHFLIEIDTGLLLVLLSVKNEHEAITSYEGLPRTSVPFNTIGVIHYREKCRVNFPLYMIFQNVFMD